MTERETQNTTERSIAPCPFFFDPSRGLGLGSALWATQPATSQPHSGYHLARAAPDNVGWGMGMDWFLWFLLVSVCVCVCVFFRVIHELIRQFFYSYSRRRTPHGHSTTATALRDY